MTRRGDDREDEGTRVGKIVGGEREKKCEETGLFLSDYVSL